MPFIYEDEEETSVINGNVHILTLLPVNTHTITLMPVDEHTLELVTPILGEGGTSDYDQLINKPLINNKVIRGSMTLEYLGIQPAGDYPYIPLSNMDIDVITGLSSTTESFINILQLSNEVTLDNDLMFTEPIVVEKNFTIDLCNQEIESNINQPLFQVIGNTLTIKGEGTIRVASDIGSATGGGKIIIGEGIHIIIAGDVITGIDYPIEILSDETTP